MLSSIFLTNIYLQYFLVFSSNSQDSHGITRPPPFPSPCDLLHLLRTLDLNPNSFPPPPPPPQARTWDMGAAPNICVYNGFIIFGWVYESCEYFPMTPPVRLLVRRLVGPSEHSVRFTNSMDLICLIDLLFTFCIFSLFNNFMKNYSCESKVVLHPVFAGLKISVSSQAGGRVYICWGRVYKKLYP